MHRDITPANVVISRTGAACLVNRPGSDAASFLEKDVDHVQALPARAACPSREDGARPPRRVPVGLRGLSGDRPEGRRGCRVATSVDGAGTDRCPAGSWTDDDRTAADQGSGT